MIRFFWLAAIAAVVSTIPNMTLPVSAADKRALTVNDLFQFKRVADPQISPDGSLVVYQMTEITDPAKNKKHTHLWLVATDGKSAARQLTSSGKSDSHPRFSPDGNRILFESNRGGSSQLYIIDLKSGGEAVKVTDISTGAGTAIWSPDGNSIAFVSAVYPEFSALPFAESNKKNAEKDQAAEDSPVKAKTFDRLFFRHWDSYVDGKRNHLFICNLDGSNCRDVTPGDRDSYPTSTTFSVGDDFIFSPDSKHLIFTAVPSKGEAWSTNHDLCRVSVENKSAEWETLTKENPGADCSPKLSNDGKTLAWRRQSQAGYEADKWNIFAVSLNADGTFNGTAKNLTEKETHSADDIVSVSNDVVTFLSDSKGFKRAFSVVGFQANPMSAFAGANTLNEGAILGMQQSSSGTVLLHATMSRPAEILYYGKNLGTQKEPFNLSKANSTFLETLNLPRPESVQVKVEDGEMQMWILMPPGFDEKKKWPVAYLVHGGPQGAWEDGWSFRWNAQAWAAQGYLVAMPNPRGSTGFGQKFVDEICGDWGGKCYRDLVAGLEMIKKLPYVDPARMGSAGGSFGGYMQNWFAVNEIAKDFKCQMSHCSVYNFESMWGTTDELWFDEWEHKGLPWEKPGSYAEFSPHKKAAGMAKYKTPMLIIHNDLDFRCPIGQGHELFATLQRQGVPSRFVNFPDEGHWVLKPANSKKWHDEVFGWFAKYCPPGGQ